MIIIYVNDNNNVDIISIINLLYTKNILIYTKLTNK